MLRKRAVHWIFQTPVKTKGTEVSKKTPQSGGSSSSQVAPHQSARLVWRNWHEKWSKYVSSHTKKCLLLLRPVNNLSHVMWRCRPTRLFCTSYGSAGIVLIEVMVIRQGFAPKSSSSKVLDPLCSCIERNANIQIKLSLKNVARFLNNKAEVGDLVADLSMCSPASSTSNCRGKQYILLCITLILCKMKKAVLTALKCRWGLTSMEV